LGYGRQLSGHEFAAMMDRHGSISIIRRVDLNDRDVSEGSDHAAALSVPFVALPDMESPLTPTLR